MPKKIKKPADCIASLVVNGLHGRFLRIPVSKKNKRPPSEILLIYGHHSSLERMYAIAESLSRHGNVIMPDLPGFGGMDSFYKIGEKPSLDNMADYLATFIKLKFKNKTLHIGGMSFGFLVVTRMLQKYPEMTKQVAGLVSIVGFLSYRDFKFKKSTYLTIRWLSSICSTRMVAGICKYLVLRPLFIRWAYVVQSKKNPKMKDADKVERDKRIDFEIKLWQCNDIRTYMDTTVTMMLVNLTKIKIGLPVWHITVDTDQYFDGRKVRASMRKVFKKITVYKAKISSHAPTIISNSDEVNSLIPKEIRKELAKIK